MKVNSPLINVLPQPVFHNQPIHKTAGLRFVCVCVHHAKYIYVCTWDEWLSEEVICEPKRNLAFYSQTKQNTQLIEEALPPQSERASGICAYLAGTWLFLRTLLHSSCILESGEHRAACFSFEERGSWGGRGSIHPSPHPPNRPWLGQFWSRKTIQTRGRLWIHDKAEHTEPQRDTARRVWLKLGYWNLSSFFSYFFPVKQKISWKHLNE